MDPFRARDAVATIARKVPSRSAEAKERSLKRDLPGFRPLPHGFGRLQSNHMDARTSLDKAADLGFANLAGADHKATFAFEFHEHWEQAAHNLLLTFHAAGHASFGQIARDRFYELSCQKIPQVRVAVTSKESPQILPRSAIGEVATQ